MKMKFWVAAIAMALVSGIYAHDNHGTGGAIAGGLVGSQSGAASSASGSVSGNGSSSDEASNNTYGYAGVKLNTTKNGVGVFTTAGTGSENQVSGSKSGHASGSASGGAGSQSGAIAGGGAFAFKGF